MKQWQFCSILALVIGVFFVLSVFAGVRKMGMVSNIRQVPDIGRALGGLQSTSRVHFASFQNPVHRLFLVSGFISEGALTSFAERCGLHESSSQLTSSALPAAFARISRALQSEIAGIRTNFSAEDRQISGEIPRVGFCEIRADPRSGAFTAVIIGRN